MADVRDIINVTGNVTTTSESQNQDIKALQKTLDNIDDNLATLSNALRGAGSLGLSQSAARDSFRTAYREQQYTRGYDPRRYGANSVRSRSGQGNGPQGFLDNFENALFGGFNASGFKKNVSNIFNNFAKELGVSIKDIPNEVGKRLGESARSKLLKNQNVRDIISKGQSFKSDVGQILESRSSQVAKLLKEGNTSGALGEVGSIAKEIRTTGVAAFKSMGSSLLKLAPQLAAVAVAAKLLKTAFDGLKRIGEALSKAFSAATAAANRDSESRKKNLEYANKRMKEDFNTLIEEPFKILKEAAQSVINSWNQNLTTVAATQGYTKADVQDLMSVIAQRLQSEGLSSYISGSDIFDNLARVLSSGMSGAIAEEFAYQATILNKAIPTQDFFGYASTYASIAANAVRAGQSQNQAIQTATKSLQDFASSLLYASRELSGGFTTGLQNASSIYEQSAKIAQAARSENMAAISSVLLATQSYIGAVAPDLASGLVDTIYKALVGGNASDIVALRSLANINASNTEFLREFASNPQKIFTSLFTNLARMYSSSSDAYMEKAEGYAQLFGLSVEAFQRVDFQGLADAIKNMNSSSSALNENMKLLAEGQTTTTAEQLKAQQINQYMIEEGLSYVIDNEAAQLIQQHMWDEQLAREMMEQEYAVNLSSSTMEVFLAIKELVNNILNFLNPIAWVKKLGNLVSTKTEAEAMQADVRQILELGKVGQGNATSLYQLSTRNMSLNLISSMADLLGGRSAYGRARASTTSFQNLSNVLFGSGATQFVGMSSQLATQNMLNNIHSPSSSYSWGSVSKTQGLAAQNILKELSGNLIDSSVSKVLSEVGTMMESSSASAVKSRINAMLSDTYLVDQYVKQGKSYADWAQSASKYGISDLDAALQAAGYTASDIMNYFQAKETEQGVQEAHEIKMQEAVFREAGINFWNTSFPDGFQTPLFSTLNTTNDILSKMDNKLQNIYDDSEKFLLMYRLEWLNKGWAAFVSSQGSNGLFNKFYNEFMNYFINHIYYSNTTGYRYQDVQAVQQSEKIKEQGTVVNALAEMLTSNLMDLTDPTKQTNALLAQILLVTEAIRAQNNAPTGASVEGSSLIDRLNSLALGLTSNGSITQPNGTVL